VFPVENDTFGVACLQDTCCVGKGRDKPEQQTQMLDFTEERGTGNEQSGEQIVTATYVLIERLSLHICKVSIKEESIIVSKYRVFNLKVDR
jgi:hypothetical protein